MKYNDREKKIRIKIVQIDNNELTKCKSGKEFKVKLVTRSRRIIVDPSRPTVTDAMEAIGNLTNVVNDLATEMRAGFKSINTRLDEHDKRFDKIDDTLADYGKRLDKIDGVLARNNLH
jgi:hypothetical protein